MTEPVMASVHEPPEPLPEHPWVWMQVVDEPMGWVPTWVAERLGCVVDWGVVEGEPHELAAVRQSRWFRSDAEFAYDQFEDEGPD